MCISRQTYPSVSTWIALLQSKAARQLEQSTFTPCFCVRNARCGPKLTQIWLEKSWLVCSKAKETSSFLSVYLKPGGKLKHHCPRLQRGQHKVTPSIFMRFTRLLLKREPGIPDFNSKADLALWVSIKCWNSNTRTLGIWEWSGIPIPAGSIPKLLLQVRWGFACGPAYPAWRPVKAAPPAPSPRQAAGCRIQVSPSPHGARSFWQFSFCLTCM